MQHNQTNLVQKSLIIFAHQ